MIIDYGSFLILNCYLGDNGGGLNILVLKFYMNFDKFQNIKIFLKSFNHRMCLCGLVFFLFFLLIWDKSKNPSVKFFTFPKWGFIFKIKG